MFRALASLQEPNRGQQSMAEYEKYLEEDIPRKRWEERLNILRPMSAQIL